VWDTPKHTSYHRTYLSYHLRDFLEISFYVILRERPGAGRREQRRCTFVSCVAMILAGLGRVVRPSGSTARVHISIQYTRLYVSSYVNVSSSL